ncbi:hybrid sensor histidine kinase/response regulator [Pleurocapsales cyanobacterium LEGE 10410]|nr:hybrid sensor histidine kinase/response regulator [Pleurocapsales cyanobacterium LEGE 10410]
MDTEQQIRLNFLDEAEEYFDLMESGLIGLAEAAVNAQEVDLVLRSAHSIKGGAAMMSFNALSRVAHRLEDFLKVLRVRYAGSSVEVEVETSLLQGVDLLRHIASQNRQEIEVKDSEIDDRTQPIFEQLQQQLGELEEADEDALLSQEEDIDPAVLIFEEGVDSVLDRFETQLQELGVAELAQEITATAQELIGFGMMADLVPFTQLCESIQQKAASISPTNITPLAEQALKTWRRSHALVMRGSIEKLPSGLENDDFSVSDNSTATIEPDASEDEAFDPLATDSLELDELQSAFELDASEEQAFDSLEATLELDELQSAFEPDANEEQAFDPLEATLELDELQSAFESDANEEQAFDPLEATLELDELQSAFESDVSEEQAFDPLDNSLNLDELQSAFEPSIPEETPTATQPNPIAQETPSLAPRTPSVDKMVRVPVSQLQQFNNLFEQLVLNRNSINLRLQQFQEIIFLMSQRISQMETSNAQLKKWYDRASLEGFLAESQPTATTANNQQSELSAGVVSSTPSNKNIPSQRFDILEMDRYTDIHLICQEQIETIVQLQEVATDIKLGIQEINLAVRDLNYTTKSMQGNVTRTQMLPFAEAVKRFPRVIRDLSLQFKKQVNLKIIGKNTLLDRSVIEALSAPLMHLLRNAFDHGIEDPQARIAAGKPETGTITIQANNLGTYSLITLSDDGNGIPLDKIRDRVVKMGISRSEVAKVSEADLLDFIFEPGFSTAKQVTELSGRGVGMDVVRTNLQEIQGNVRVATEPGKGTTFTLRIPFTLSILKVAIVEQAGVIFALPANSIRELVPVTPELVTTSPDAKHLSWNQTKVPLVEIDRTLVYRRIRKAVDLTGSPAIDRTMALIVGDKESLAALQISCFWYEQESTIRSIDSPIPLPPGIISSVIFGDGKVIPLVDPMSLVEECLKNPSTNVEGDLNLPKPQNISLAKTILVVDDSINVRRYLSLTLEKAGYQVEQAKDGREAVDKLLGGLAVNAVICDIEMPRLDGYGVLEEIKERAEFEHLPIAMLTSRSNEKHRKVAMNLGASAYFSKPYNEGELLDKLGELLHNQG